MVGYSIANYDWPKISYMHVVRHFPGVHIVKKAFYLGFLLEGLRDQLPSKVVRDRGLFNVKISL